MHNAKLSITALFVYALTAALEIHSVNVINNLVSFYIDIQIVFD